MNLTPTELIEDYVVDNFTIVGFWGEYFESVLIDYDPCSNYGVCGRLFQSNMNAEYYRCRKSRP